MPWNFAKLNSASLQATYRAGFILFVIRSPSVRRSLEIESDVEDPTAPTTFNQVRSRLNRRSESDLETENSELEACLGRGPSKIEEARSGAWGRAVDGKEGGSSEDWEGRKVYCCWDGEKDLAKSRSTKLTKRTPGHLTHSHTSFPKVPSYQRTQRRIKRIQWHRHPHTRPPDTMIFDICTSDNALLARPPTSTLRAPPFAQPLIAASRVLHFPYRIVQCRSSRAIQQEKGKKKKKRTPVAFPSPSPRGLTEITKVLSDARQPLLSKMKYTGTPTPLCM
ncbi:hypothetical protein BJ875DRAFT_444664 [Amylocarpus encephaloides]|uniref:Uncharacterized protein n=1 Tax=Amylocarpus encephaloides TaxID=45428 RepID=A0A9P7YBT7_9HELO|nr:hypothetical protein BJ875DRAFT_444664 [Amylocarpus encephaloides]